MGVVVVLLDFGGWEGLILVVLRFDVIRGRVIVRYAVAICCWLRCGLC